MGIARIGALLSAIALAGAGLAIGPTVAARAADSPAAGDPTISNNSLRDGWDEDEPDLLPANVTASDFGPLFSTTVTGQIYAQPLIAKQSASSTGTLIVATEQDNVYGMNPVSGAIDWSRSLGTPWSSTVLGCGDLTPDIGVTSTPVYDPTTNTVYVMAKDAPDGADSKDPRWLLHALDASTGTERAGWPVQIGGHPDNDPTETFNAESAAQRPGLLLLDGVVYAGFASYCDYGPYNGYVAGVSTATAKQTALFTTEVGTDDGEGGIWQSGGGLVSDGPGQIIVTTGNGDTSPVLPTNAPPTSLEEAVVRLTVQPDGTLKATDWFSPDSRATLDEIDSDFGSGGPMAIPDGYGTTSYPHLLVQDGKDGHVYLLDRDALGGLGQGPGGSDNALGVTGPYDGMWGHPAFWGGPDGAYVYTVESNGYLRALQLTADSSGVPSLTSVATSTATFGYTSGSPVVTSDGASSTSALVWVVSVIGSSGRAPVLNAYNAMPSNGVLKKIYSAPLNPPGVTDPNLAVGGEVHDGGDRRRQGLCRHPRRRGVRLRTPIVRTTQRDAYRLRQRLRRGLVDLAGDAHRDEGGQHHQGCLHQAVRGCGACDAPSGRPHHRHDLHRQRQLRADERRPAVPQPGAHDQGRQQDRLGHLRPGRLRDPTRPDRVAGKRGLRSGAGRVGEHLGDQRRQHLRYGRDVHPRCLDPGRRRSRHRTFRTASPTCRPGPPSRSR